MVGAIIMKLEPTIHGVENATALVGELDHLIYSIEGALDSPTELVLEFDLTLLQQLRSSTQEALELLDVALAACNHS